MVDLYGNDDYAAAEDEILGTKATFAEKPDSPPADTTQASNTADSAPAKPATTTTQPAATFTPKPAESAPEPVRQAPAPPPQIGSSIATYTSDEGTTLPPSSYNAGYGSSAPQPIRSYDSQADQQSTGGSFNDASQTGGYNNQSDGNSYQQKQGGYTNGAVYESSNQGGYGGGQRPGYGGFNAGGGGRRFDSVRPSEMKDEG